MMKEDLGVSKAQAWGCAWNPQEIFKETHASKLGDAPVHPLLHRQSLVRPSLHNILITSCVMCYLGASRSLLFLGCFCFVCWSLQCRNLTCLIARDTRSTLN